ncbi:hypothetical protein ACIQH7_09795 [Streptomyces anulatus]|uniref:hypothetical protein n=1 Tax=Streptomyces sp. NPDC088719 TaxID=3365872 RepID=UPI003826AB53
MQADSKGTWRPFFHELMSCAEIFGGIGLAVRRCFTFSAARFCVSPDTSNNSASLSAKTSRVGAVSGPPPAMRFPFPGLGFPGPDPDRETHRSPLTSTEEVFRALRNGRTGPSRAEIAPTRYTILGYRRFGGSVTLTTMLAVIGGIVIILGAAARIPNAVAELIRACIPVINAFHELRTALKRTTPQSGQIELKEQFEPPEPTFSEGQTDDNRSPTVR